MQCSSRGTTRKREEERRSSSIAGHGQTALLHFTSQVDCSRQSLVHTPPVQVPVHFVWSLQSKLQFELVQTMLHLAVSSH